MTRDAMLCTVQWNKCLSVMKQRERERGGGGGQIVARERIYYHRLLDKLHCKPKVVDGGGKGD